jgi:hypothetical protein
MDLAQVAEIAERSAAADVADELVLMSETDTSDADLLPSETLSETPIQRVQSLELQLDSVSSLLSAPRVRTLSVYRCILFFFCFFFFFCFRCNPRVVCDLICSKPSVRVSASAPDNFLRPPSDSTPSSASRHESSSNSEQQLEVEAAAPASPKIPSSRVEEPKKNDDRNARVDAVEPLQTPARQPPPEEPQTVMSTDETKSMPEMDGAESATDATATSAMSTSDHCSDRRSSHSRSRSSSTAGAERKDKKPKKEKRDKERAGSREKDKQSREKERSKHKEHHLKARRHSRHSRRMSDSAVCESSVEAPATVAEPPASSTITPAHAQPSAVVLPPTSATATQPAAATTPDAPAPVAPIPVIKKPAIPSSPKQQTSNAAVAKSLSVISPRALSRCFAASDCFPASRMCRKPQHQADAAG